MASNEQNSVPKTAVSKKVGSMLGFDAHFWEQLMLGSLAVVGVAGVAVALFTAAVIISQRRENSEAKAEFDRYKIEAGEKVAELNEQSDRLKADAEASRAEIAKANEGAAEANKVAAKANERAVNAALELEKFRAPRILSAEQLRRISDKIKPFAGTTFVVGIVEGSKESVDLATQLEDMISAAGWKQTGWAGSMIMLKQVGRPMAGSVTVSGIVVQLHPDNFARLEKAATTLVISLEAEELTVVASQSPHGVNPMNEGDVHLLVGPKQ